jgi:hypothetical protein
METADRTLRGDYLAWLHEELTRESKYPDRTYLDLVTAMFDKEFPWDTRLPWCIPMDDNRLADGMELRAEFSVAYGIPRSDMLCLNPCSFVEVLLGLSRRLSFVAGGSAHRWAWQLVENLELHRMWDRLSRSKMHRVGRILDTVIQRQYGPDGSGGFFPLAWAERDQREVELWYQLNAYVEELHPEHR